MAPTITVSIFAGWHRARLIWRVGFQKLGHGHDQRFGLRVRSGEEASKDRSTPDPAVNRRGDRCVRPLRTWLQFSMWPLPVVVRGVGCQHPSDVPFTEDQHLVGDFGSHGQDEALGEAVRPRTSRRDLDHRDARICEH